MWVAAGCLLLLLGCGPVLLGEELPGGQAGASGDASGLAGATPSQDASTTSGSSGGQVAGQPVVSVRINAVDCGRCFELHAQATQGQLPYTFEWEDGSRSAERRVCIDGGDATLWVLAQDASGTPSSRHIIALGSAADAGCAPAGEPDAGTDAGTAPMLCLDNPSFEGMPTDFFAGGVAFEAPPWTACTNPVSNNMPAIGNDVTSQTGTVPPPTDGATYLGLGEGQQVSQALCREVTGGETLHLAIDLARVELGGDLVPQTEKVFLEIHGGLSVDCSQNELMWASPELQPGWQHFCVTLRPQSFTTQVTLRANSDMSLPSPAYLLVDNLQPVASCP
jgi:hypothetical protein